jgi:hypothetical protein
MSDHDQFRFSVTCHSDDKAVIYCLRALTHFAERHQTKNIGWGGTGDDVWQREGHCITLRFTHPEYRQVFRDVANDLLNGRWTERGSSDANPAPRAKAGIQR